MEFLAAFAAARPVPAALPGILGRLQGEAGKACEVNYHPEDVDYDLKAGPGYTWKGEGGRTYHLRIMGTAEEADAVAAALRSRWPGGVQVRGSVVAWPKEPSTEEDAYLEGVLKAVVK